MKKAISIILCAFLGFIAVGAVYWNFRVYQEKDTLKEIAKVFQQACNSQSGCIEMPAGWEKDFDGSYFKDGMSYKLKGGSFTLSHHIATDVYIVATGGKDIPLNVLRKVE